MNENRYGNLLDKYTSGSRKSNENPIKKEEGKNRYGNLLDSIKPDDFLERNMERACNTINAMTQIKEKREEQVRNRIQEREELKQKMLEECKKQNRAFVEPYLEKKRAEAKEREERKKEEERLR